MNKQIYIHYGSTKFDPAKGFPIKNEECWVKPIGGLWASRKNASSRSNSTDLQLT